MNTAEMLDTPLRRAMLEHSVANATLFKKLKSELKLIYGDDKDLLDLHMEAIITANFYPTG
mgnify:CR=1 FL=1